MFRPEDPDMNRKNSVRLFFALWPDQAVREKILSCSSAILRKQKGRQVADYNLHMTLHFIGNTTIDNMQCLDAQASRVASPAFNLVIDKVGYFQKPGIIWLGCNFIPAQLGLLHSNLGSQLSSCEYEPEKRKYRPHISLFRKASLIGKPLIEKPFSWQPEGFSLIESTPERNGVKYTEIRKYRFQDGQLSE